MQWLHEWKVNTLTLRGLPTILRYGAEVSRGHSREGNEPSPEAKGKDGGLTDNPKD
jgi:hypothetical protein